MFQTLNPLLVPAKTGGACAAVDAVTPVLRGVRPAALGTALFTALCLHATASAQTAEVLHWWTSKGESAAVQELATAFERAGGKWVDSAVAGGDNARNTLINRLLGGKPPTVAQFTMTRQFNEIADEGVLVDMNAVAAQQGWDKVLPEPVQRVVKVKGRYLGVPVGIHNPSWIWTSKAVLAKAGVTAEPQSMTEFFAALDKVRAIGVTPLALGGQSWQEFSLFHTVLHASGGPALYTRFFTSKDGAVAETPEMKKVLTDFKRLKGYVDAGSPNRDWNLATAMIISDRAGFQVMGDWAKGEFNSARKVAGKDYGCFLPFGPKASYLLEGDLFIFPRSKDPKVLKAQQLFASVVMSPSVQTAFAAKKGAVPVRSDVDMSNADVCAQAGAAALKDSSRLLNTPEQLLDPDRAAQMGDVVTKFWNTNQSVNDAAKALGAALRY